MGSTRWASIEQARAFVHGDPLGLELLDWTHGVMTRLGGAELRVAPTQVGWARRRGFVFIWSVEHWLAGPAPWVLTLALSQPEHQPRWKQVNQVRPGLWNHHLEVRSGDELDEELAGLIARAYAEAG